MRMRPVHGRKRAVGQPSPSGRWCQTGVKRTWSCGSISGRSRVTSFFRQSARSTPSPSIGCQRSPTRSRRFGIVRIVNRAGSSPRRTSVHFSGADSTPREPAQRSTERRSFAHKILKEIQVHPPLPHRRRANHTGRFRKDAIDQLGDQFGELPGQRKFITGQPSVEHRCAARSCPTSCKSIRRPLFENAPDCQGGFDDALKRDRFRVQIDHQIVRPVEGIDPGEKGIEFDAAEVGQVKQRPLILANDVSTRTARLVGNEAVSTQDGGGWAETSFWKKSAPAIPFGWRWSDCGRSCRWGSRNGATFR